MKRSKRCGRRGGSQGDRQAIRRLAFRIQVDVLDCLGCGSWLICPGMRSEGGDGIHRNAVRQPEELGLHDRERDQQATPVDVKLNVKNSQFATRSSSFRGRIPVAGTPYIKLITQLFGDRMMIKRDRMLVIYGAAPSTLAQTRDKGRLGNSLFENNAETWMVAMRKIASQGPGTVGKRNASTKNSRGVWTFRA